MKKKKKKKLSRLNFLQNSRVITKLLRVFSSNVKNKEGGKGGEGRGGNEVVNERTSCVWMRMTQQPWKSRLVASWWARRETSSVDSNYRYPTPRPLAWGCIYAIYMLQVLIALHGCDRSASFAAGHEFVDASTREGRGLDHHRRIFLEEGRSSVKIWGVKVCPKSYSHSIDLPSIHIRTENA